VLEGVSRSNINSRLRAVSEEWPECVGSLASVGLCRAGRAHDLTSVSLTHSLTTLSFQTTNPIFGFSPSSPFNMRFSSAATLFTLASSASATPTVRPREHALSYDTNYGAKYQSGIFYVNWVCKFTGTSKKSRTDKHRLFTVANTSLPTFQPTSSPRSTTLSQTSTTSLARSSSQMSGRIFSSRTLVTLPRTARNCSATSTSYTS
jgi:hypothetical protein